jgi:signal transduction histidine kinase/ActR/RegA family two-component response regulator
MTPSISVTMPAQDVAGRRASETGQASRKHETFLLRFADAIRSCEDSDELQRTACRLLGEHLGVDRVHYGEIRADERIAIVGPDYCTPGTRSLTGRYPLETFGSTPRLSSGRVAVVDDVAGPSDLGETTRRTCRALGIAAFIIAPLLRDGRLVWTLSVHSATPRTWTPDEVALVREAGERTWADVQRARAQAELALANRRKDEFLATLAHELRNPLAPIRNGLQITRLSTRNDETLQRVVAMMDRQLTHLVKLVDDLLDVARIGAGKIVLERRPVDVAEVLARSVERARALLDERDHTLDVEVPAGSVMVDADAERLAQVFTNLLSNAAKYTERGGRVSVRLEVADEAAVVHVADTGIGIAPEDLSHVFDLFSQARAPGGVAEGGLGIGLALVRKLVEIHGGSVTAQSDGWGRGCTMSVRLPLLRVESGSEGPSQVAPLAPATAGRTVVVADDNVDAADSLGMLLRFDGHDVTIVHDGEAAVAAVQERRPDVVVLDLGMPGLDGLEAAKRIRAMPGGQDVKLIALTGWGQDSDRVRTREAGFDHHLVKPADPAEVAALLHGREAEDGGSLLPG